MHLNAYILTISVKVFIDWRIPGCIIDLTIFRDLSVVTVDVYITDVRDSFAWYVDVYWSMYSNTNVLL